MAPGTMEKFSSRIMPGSTVFLNYCVTHVRWRSACYTMHCLLYFISAEVNESDVVKLGSRSLASAARTHA